MQKENLSAPQHTAQQPVLPHVHLKQPLLTTLHTPPNAQHQHMPGTHKKKPGFYYRANNAMVHISTRTKKSCYLSSLLLLLIQKSSKHHKNMTTLEQSMEKRHSNTLSQHTFSIICSITPHFKSTYMERKERIKIHICEK